MGERFGTFAKAKRLEVAISLRHVAEELGFTPAYISDIERGNRAAPSPERARRWAEVIGASPDHFERLALLDRDSVDLWFDQDEESSERNEAALALHRHWTEMDENQFREILKIVRSRDE